jgi:hypothetical protein
MRAVPCHWLSRLCFCLAVLLICAGPRSAASDPPSIEVMHRVARLKCMVAALPANVSVTIELRYETHVQMQRSGGLEHNAVRLRQSLEAPKKAFVALRPFETGSWRIVDTTFPPDAFFGEHTQRACSQGCALHEVHSIDMWRRVFVSRPSSGALLHTDLNLSGIEERYGDTPRAAITFAGFGDSETFGFHFEQYLGATDVTRTRALCEY